MTAPAPALSSLRVFRLPGRSAETTRRVVAALARLYGSHPLMRYVAVHHVGAHSTMPQLEQARRVHRWVQRRFRFVLEAGEQVQTPARTILWGYGDCDDLSALVAALLTALRIEWRLMLLAYDWPGSPPQPFHIWVQARLDGRWVDLETSDPTARFGEPPVAVMRRRRVSF